MIEYAALFTAERRLASRPPVSPAPPARPALPRKVKPAIQRTLIGMAAPGLSRPTTIKGDPETLEERILPSAWECVKIGLQAGIHFDITTGHGGPVICRSDSKRFRARFDSKAGMLFEIDVEGTGVARPADCFCSIGLVPIIWEHRFYNGRFIREVHEMRLGHLAILPSAWRPSYPLAKVRSVRSHEAARESLRLLLDTRVAVNTVR